ncbi:MAG TPA: hypothetical protein VHZ50_19300 [Puia sp.]|nr:hypothetical protein [Puia sp.]
MEDWYQRRTQKGIGRTQKTMHTGIAKNPRLLKACNITPVIGDMGEFFFIYLIDGNRLKKFNHAKKNNFSDEWNFFTVKFWFD